MLKFKVACSQLSIETDPLINFQKAVETVRISSKNKTDLVIFPEDFINGVLRGDKIKVASKKTNGWIKKFQVLAKKFNLCIVPGSFPLYHDGKIYNTTFFINNDGRILSTYKKINLWLDERDDYTPGKINEIKPIETPFGKMGLTICWDLVEPSIIRKYAQLGADLIINISMWYVNQSQRLKLQRGKPNLKYSSNFDSKLVDALVQARSYENGIVVIFCNFAGTHKFQSFYNKKVIDEKIRSAGHSQIVVPNIGSFAKLNNRREALLIADISKLDKLFDDYNIFYGIKTNVKSKRQLK